LDELIIRALQGRATDEEVERLQDWRDEAEENEARFRSFAAVWRATPQQPRQIAPRPPVDETLRRIRTPRSAALRRWPNLLSHAAAVVMTLVAGAVLVHLRETTPQAIVTHTAFITGSGESATVSLDDGTVVRLSQNTRLVLGSGDAVREVHLDGRAFFAVTTDSANPFLVRTPAGNVHVHGTRFELNAEREDLRVVVVEGRVAVASNGGAVQLSDRQVSHVRRGEPPSVMEIETVWPLLNWLGEFIAFESTPIPAVAEELSERFGVRLLVEDETIQRQTVTAWFGQELVDEIVGVICRIVEARCVMEGSVVRMYNGNPAVISNQRADSPVRALPTAMKEAIR
jgi:transmembrane sensor